MTRDETLTAEEVEGINNKNRYNINPVINKDSDCNTYVSSYVPQKCFESLEVFFEDFELKEIKEND